MLDKIEFELKKEELLGYVINVLKRSGYQQAQIVEQWKKLSESLTEENIEDLLKWWRLQYATVMNRINLGYNQQQIDQVLARLKKELRS